MLQTNKGKPPAAPEVLPDAAPGAADAPPTAGPLDVQAIVSRAMSAAGDMTEAEESALAEVCASVRVLYHGLRRGPGRLPKRLADVITINHALAALAYTYGGGVADGDDEP